VCDIIEGNSSDGSLVFIPLEPLEISDLVSCRLRVLRERAEELLHGQPHVLSNFNWSLYQAYGDVSWYRRDGRWNIGSYKLFGGRKN
jgi:hypothetical protein